MSDSESELFGELNTDIAEEEETKNTSNQLEVQKSNECSTETLTTQNSHFKKDNVEEETSLEDLVFGNKKTLLNRFAEQVNKKRKNNDSEEGNKRKAVWHDSDDEDNIRVGDVLVEKRQGSLNHLNKDKSYKSLLTKRFERVVTTPKWADLDREEEVDSDEEILKTVGHLAPSTHANLQNQFISFKKLKDLNRATYSEGPITDIQFHPTSTVAIASGENGVATVYSIDGLKNDKLHSMQFKNFPIKCSKLLANGKDMIIGSIRNFCYCYDLIKMTATRIFLPKVMTKLKNFAISPDNNFIVASGRFGEVHLLDMNSKELLYTFKQEDQCTSLVFSNDSKKIFSHSTTSTITIFDIRQQKVDHIFSDEGCIKGNCVAINPSSSLVATGSHEGVVNVYNYTDVFKTTNPIPQKVIYNLRTSITDLKFNHTGEILGLCSNKIDNAVRLVHFPTASVYMNFPGDQIKFGKVRRLEFSPNSGFFAMGNFKGEVPLLRLKHFNNY
ncbi:U3 small nucleolar RNA-associated protein 18 homolog [Condylostylus longicornis]|uniref:U3 small nucleolar RNA-associated protein 18 homolog n=1 Tax=Condylostylus longicornis TaxID=2530218 RepID=UPI00244E51F3|nr:U3 small nucleolar RNA-associated protein 18 homolog [Condylostylus longicornis]